MQSRERKKSRVLQKLAWVGKNRLEGSLHACQTWWNCKIPYLRGDPMSKVGGVGLLPALCRRRTAWRLNVLRSRRKATASSLACAAALRQTQVKHEPRSAEPVSLWTSHPLGRRNTWVFCHIREYIQSMYPFSKVSFLENSILDLLSDLNTFSSSLTFYFRISATLNVFPKTSLFSALLPTFPL